MKMKTDDKIRKALRSLPKDLKETYQKIFSEITGPEEHPADREQALKLFRWLACSERPLTLYELMHVTAIKDVQAGITESSLPSTPEQILSLGGNLVKSDGNFVEFIHLSVKDTMLGTNTVGGTGLLGSEADVHLSLSFDCLTYLSIVSNSSRQFSSHDTNAPEASSMISESTTDSATDAGSMSTASTELEVPAEPSNTARVVRREWELLKYAAQYWGKHVSKAKSAQLGERLGIRVCKFLKSSDLAMWLGFAADAYERQYYAEWQKIPGNWDDIQRVHKSIQYIVSKGQSNLPKERRIGRRFIDGTN
jgi:hypothetical protein